MSVEGNNMSAQKTFNLIFLKLAAVSTVEFEDSWHNGTGYFDPIIKADLGLMPGARTTAVDENGRRMIIVGTRYGNAVVFERYSENEDGVKSNIITSNCPRQVTPLFGVASGSLTSDKVFSLTNSILSNVGTQVEQVCGK